jgi:hypothetical protein
MSKEWNWNMPVVFVDLGFLIFRIVKYKPFTSPDSADLSRNGPVILMIFVSYKVQAVFSYWY